MRSLVIVFALVILAPSSASSQSCGSDGTCISDAPRTCKVDMQSIYQVQGCRASVTASWSGFSNPRERSSCIANPPQGYQLIDHNLRIIGRNNGDPSISKYTAGLDYQYDRTVDEAYKSSLNLAGKIADTKKRLEVEASIKDDWERHAKLVENVKTNADTVRLEVTAQGHGSPVDRKRGWMDASVVLLIRCVVPVNLDEQLKSRYGLDGVKDNLPRELLFTNDTRAKIYVSTKPADIFTTCENTSFGSSITTLKANSDIEMLSDPEIQICYFVHNSSKDRVKFDNRCRANAGDKLSVSKISKECKS